MIPSLLLATFCLITNALNLDLPYNQDTAINALYYSYGAYCDADDLANWSCQWCQLLKSFHIESVINGNYLQAFIGYDTVNSSIIISFRGTNNNANKLSDLIEYTVEGHLDYLYPPDNKNYSLHYGIYKSYLSLESLGLSNQIKAVFNKYPNANILVTGHSLGGALAAIAALDLKVSPIYNSSKHLMGDVNVITFGSPKWCNVNLAKYFDSVIDASFRVVNKNDVIPSNPPIELDFHHVSMEIRYTNNDPLTYKICTEPFGNYYGCYYGISVYDHLNYFGLKLDCVHSNASTNHGMFGYDAVNTTNANLEMNDTDFFASTSMMESTQSAEIIIIDSKHGVPLETIQRIAVMVVGVFGFILFSFFVVYCCIHIKQVQEIKERMKRMASHKLQMEQYLL